MSSKVLPLLSTRVVGFLLASIDQVLVGTIIKVGVSILGPLSSAIAKQVLLDIIR